MRCHNGSHRSQSTSIVAGIIAPFIARRIHAVDATVGVLDGFESSSSRASARVFQPSVICGSRGPSQLALTLTPQLRSDSADLHTSPWHPEQ
jgi:hypothetical protein